MGARQGSVQGGSGQPRAAETMSKNAERTDQRSGQHAGVKWPH